MELPNSFEPLPPPSLPLTPPDSSTTATAQQQQAAAVPISGDSAIPLRSWERHQAKKLFQLNRCRATALTAPPTTANGIDLAVVRQGGDALRAAVAALLTDLHVDGRSGGAGTAAELSASLTITRLGGGMTNLMFVVAGQLPSAGAFRVLMRVYGHGTDKFFSRERELYILQVLSGMGIGPRLLGMFANGRFEEFLSADTLTPALVRQPDISRSIAHKLYEIHAVVGIVAEDIDDNNADESPRQSAYRRRSSVPSYHSELWTRIYDWHSKACDSVAQLLADSRHSAYHTRLRQLDIASWLPQIQWLQCRIEALNSPVVFCHNDSQYGNIMRMRSDGSILIIDYEYACYNYRGFDIANHFCEWAADYHSETPHILDFRRLPSEQDQRTFFTAYLDAKDAFIGTSPYRGSRRRSHSSASSLDTKPLLSHHNNNQAAGVSSDDSAGTHSRQHSRALTATGDHQLALSSLMLGPSPRLSPTLSPMLTPHHLKMLRIQELQRLRIEVDHFVLASHVMWALWGLVQASQSVIEFDYISYSLQRFDEYMRWKAQVLRQ